MELEGLFAHSSAQSGSSGTLTGIEVSAKEDKFLVVCVATDNTAFSSVTSIYLSSPEITNAYALTRKTQTTGAEIWWLKEPAYTPGLYTHTLTFNLSGSYNWAASAYVFNGADQTGNLSFRTFGFDANTTGEPDSPSAVSVQDGDYMLDAVRISQNNIDPNGSQVANMYVNTGSGATLYSYASSYEDTGTNASYQPGWTRTGTPVNATWGYCFAVLKPSTSTYARVVCS